MRDMAETLRDTFDRVFPNRRRSARHGRIEKFTVNDRLVSVYLPPGYDDRADQRYPVLYMQDGQNLFEPVRAFGGTAWRLDEAADRVIFHRKARPMIIAGIDHAGSSRIDEYTPTRDELRNAGGGAQAYAQFLIGQIKPAVELRYRTTEEAAIGGSSLGGLVALYLALRRPDVFSAAAVMSPSVWWNGQSALQFVDAFDGKQPRLWVDIGAREGAEALAGARALRDRLRSKGWSDLHYEEDRKADHSERAWARRVPRVLEFLFPAV
jgi:predicted alpha/beta superfamily hydrolase